MDRRGIRSCGLRYRRGQSVARRVFSVGSPALIIIPAWKPGVTAGRRPGRMPGPSAREGKPAVGTTPAERAHAPATATVPEGYRPGRWIPASCRNDGRDGRAYDQGRMAQRGPRMRGQSPWRRPVLKARRGTGLAFVHPLTCSTQGLGSRHATAQDVELPNSVEPGT